MGTHERAFSCRVGPRRCRPRRRGPRLLTRVRRAIRLRHYSRRTEKAYVGWIKRFIFFNGTRHPDEMGEHEVMLYLSDLAVRKQRERVHAEPGLQRAAVPVPGRPGPRARRVWRKAFAPSARSTCRSFSRGGEVERGAGRAARTGLARRVAALRFGLASPRVPDAARQGPRLRAGRDHRARRQGPEGSRDGAAGASCATRCVRTSTASACSTSATSPRAPAARCCLTRSSGSIPTRAPSGPGSGSFRRRATTCTPGCSDAAATTSTRRSSSEPSTTPLTRRRHREARDLPHAAALVRDAPAGGRLRHPHDPGTAGPQRRLDDDDLHARPEPWRARRPQPARPGMSPQRLSEYTDRAQHVRNALNELVFVPTEEPGGLGYAAGIRLCSLSNRCSTDGTAR